MESFWARIASISLSSVAIRACNGKSLGSVEVRNKVRIQDSIVNSLPERVSPVRCPQTYSHEQRKTKERLLAASHALGWTTSAVSNRRDSISPQPARVLLKTAFRYRWRGFVGRATLSQNCWLANRSAQDGRNGPTLLDA